MPVDFHQTVGQKYSSQCLHDYVRVAGYFSGLGCDVVQVDPRQHEQWLNTHIHTNTVDNVDQMLVTVVLILMPKQKSKGSVRMTEERKK